MALSFLQDQVDQFIQQLRIVWVAMAQEPGGAFDAAANKGAARGKASMIHNLT
jgi:hypothetical protein